MTRRAAFIHSEQMERYSYPAESPFIISRAGKTREILDTLGLLTGEGRRQVAPVRPDNAVLEKFHSARYLHTLKSASEGKFDTEAVSMGIGTPDCPVFRDMYDYSVMAFGGTLKGVDLILCGEADVVFNPSGGLHHAGPERASGFCYLNDAALGCMTLAQAGKKVLYLDVDVHHGDGVQNAFYDRPDVMTISLHESGRTLFPGTGFIDEIGTGKGRGYSVNIPLVVGTYDKVYIKAFNAIALPLIEAFNPDVFVFELGADGLAGDPLAHLQLTNNTYTEIIGSLLNFDRPVLMTGGGGYNIDNTIRAWALAWSVLCGAENAQRQGGLRDKELVVSSRQQQAVEPVIDATIDAVKSKVFSFHGLQ